MLFFGSYLFGIQALVDVCDIAGYVVDIVHLVDVISCDQIAVLRRIEIVVLKPAATLFGRRQA
jgi:hypothetical protein